MNNSSLALDWPEPKLAAAAALFDLSLSIYLFRQPAAAID